MPARTRLLLSFGLLLFSGACGGSQESPARSSTTADQAGGGPSAAAAWLHGVELPALLDCARDQGATLIQAHRTGARPGAAENSLAAIEASLADGAVFLEMDLAETADGVLVLMHDETIDRTTTGSGPIDDMTYAQLTEVQLVDPNGVPTAEGVPTFAEALATLNGRGIAQVDPKDVGLAQVAGALESNDALDRAVVITYSLGDAIDLHRLAPEIMISASLRGLDELASLDAADVDRSRVTAWLGLGSGDPALDRALAEVGIETSFGDFRAEARGRADYRAMATQGAEVLSVDDVAAAAAALGSRADGRAVWASCPRAGS
jgi:glycerophosphoryl diester phosphodiesterase